MMHKTMKKHMTKFLAAIIKIIIVLAFIVPLYLSVNYSLKSEQEIVNSGLGFSTNLTIENYVKGFKTPGFLTSFFNSIVTTIPTVALVLFICAQGAYAISRSKLKIMQSFYYLFVASLLVPFQTLMLPLYINLKSIHLFNSLIGFILVRVGFQIAYNILLFTGFIKTVPVELEEAAFLDGLDRKRTFWFIVFPLLKPVLVTSAIINTVYTWNDFQTALIILQKTALRTLPLLQYAFFGEHYTDLGLAFAVFNMSVIPIIIMYLISQKQIMSGLTAGAVKS